MTTNVIPMTPCESSQIQSYGYDAASKTLAVHFHRGAKVYLYQNTEPELAAKFTGAESKGKAFGQFIKGREFTCCTPAEAAVETEGGATD